MADPAPRIPSSDDIRRLFEQLPAQWQRDGEAKAPPRADEDKETPHE